MGLFADYFKIKAAKLFLKLYLICLAIDLTRAGIALAVGLSGRIV